MSVPSLLAPPRRDEQWLARVAECINSDAEMALVGGQLDATIAFTFGEWRHDLVLEGGRVAVVRAGRRIDDRCSFGFRASDATWDKFFGNPPPPLYNNVFAMLMRVDDFHLDGDGMAWAQNVRAVSRLLAVMQAEGARHG